MCPIDVLSGSMVQLEIEPHDECRDGDINLGICKAI